MKVMSGVEEKLASRLTRFEVNETQVIQNALEKNAHEESNHNLINMILWLEKFPLYYQKEKNYLLVFGVYEEEAFMYMPFCEEDMLKEALQKAEEIFKEIKEPLVFNCFTEEMMEKVIALSSNYQVTQCLGASDYIYDAQKLINMSGKKLQKKRNHMNAFFQEYQGRYHYESLNEENVMECLEFLGIWKQTEKDDFLKNELNGVRRILNLFHQVPYRGGCIRIDGKVEAFAIGSVLSDRMIQENIEKANGGIRGLYPVMLREFLSHEFPNAVWVNREDDMGYENLKKSKKSYYPQWMIHKYRLTAKEEER